MEKTNNLCPLGTAVRQKKKTAKQRSTNKTASTEVEKKEDVVFVVSLLHNNCFGGDGVTNCDDEPTAVVTDGEQTANSWADAGTPET